MNTREQSFLSHMLRYCGVGLISGSIVHAGTLGGSVFKYVILIICGMIAFAIGNLIEHKNVQNKELLIFIAISTVVSIGTGMVSGGVQHYLDNPIFGAGIITLGLIISYISFTYRDFKNTFSIKYTFLVTLISIIVGLVLYFIGMTLSKTSHGHNESVPHHIDN